MSLNYHAGQVEVQKEANSRPAADMLAERTSERSERVLSFYAAADLLVLATADDGGVLRFTALSGDAPLLSPVDDETLQLHDGAGGLRDGSQAGAIAISLRERRRARANGTVRVDGARVYLRAGGADQLPQVHRALSGPAGRLSLRTVGSAGAGD